jgi:hypothetical protein
MQYIYTLALRVLVVLRDERRTTANGANDRSHVNADDGDTPQRERNERDETTNEHTQVESVRAAIVARCVA